MAYVPISDVYETYKNYKSLSLLLYRGFISQKKRLHQAQKDFFVFKLKKTQKFSEKNLLISKLFANFVVKLNFATNAKFLMIWKLLI